MTLFVTSLEGDTTVTATGTDTDSKIQLTSLDGLTGKVSIGKSF